MVMEHLFKDLVEELDQFEQDLQILQDRIGRFMDDAKQACGDGTDLSSGGVK